MTTATFPPTAEQSRAIRLATEDQNLVIEALAGAGKTTTLRLIAEELFDKRGQYIAFNKKIVTDAAASFPSSVRCNTAHSLAMQGIGYRYRHRLNDARRSNRDIAKALGLDPETPTIVDVGEETVELAAERIASLAAQTVERYCQTGDAEIEARHAPFVRGLDKPGGDSYPGNDYVAGVIAPLARVMWESLQDPEDVRFRFTHGHYLKMWERMGPVIDCDYVLFDEAQDANPVMLSIVEAQAARGTKVIWVGDTHQQIYSFTGAVNAMAKVQGNRTHLTQSFRFGPEIAGAANKVLGRLGAGVEVIGSGPGGIVGPTHADDIPDVYLARTNGGAISRAMALIQSGYRVYIQGGMDHVIRFCEAALQLQRPGGRTSHPEISCFATWDKVVEYVEDGGDPAAADLRLLVNLVETYGARELIDVLNSTARSPQAADVTVSTAHKSKGAEWDRVELIGDFPPAPEAEELRLLYVAVTRAKRHLDAEAVDLDGRTRSLFLDDGFDPQGAGSIDPDEDDDYDRRTSAISREFFGGMGDAIAAHYQEATVEKGHDPDGPAQRLMGRGQSDDRRGER